MLLFVAWFNVTFEVIFYDTKNAVLNTPPPIPRGLHGLHGIWLFSMDFHGLLKKCPKRYICSVESPWMSMDFY